MPTQPVPLITLIERNSNDIEAVYKLLERVDLHLGAHDARFDWFAGRLDAHDARFDAHDARFDAIDAQLGQILTLLKSDGS